MSEVCSGEQTFAQLRTGFTDVVLCRVSVRHIDENWWLCCPREEEGEKKERKNLLYVVSLVGRPPLELVLCS